MSIQIIDKLILITGSTGGQKKYAATFTERVSTQMKAELHVIVVNYFSTLFITCIENVGYD